MKETDLIQVEIPGSLWSSLDICFRRQGITADIAVVRLIDAVPGLSETDLRELHEPRKERTRRQLTLSIGDRRKVLIERLSRAFGSSPSAILCRLLYAFFISKEIAFFSAPNEIGIRLQRTQLRFDFNKQHERDSALLPLVERDNPPEVF
jgi:hypothetical protein